MLNNNTDTIHYKTDKNIFIERYQAYQQPISIPVKQHFVMVQLLFLKTTIVI